MFLRQGRIVDLDPEETLVLAQAAPSVGTRRV